MTTREEIITALLSLGEEKGLANVSLADIADEVGIRKASIYSHFESQQALVDAMILHCRKELSTKTFAVDFKAKDAHIMLAALFDNIIRVFAEKPISSFFSIVQQQRMYDKAFASEDRTDFAADLMTAAVMRKICDVLSDSSDWETDRLADGLIELFRKKPADSSLL